MCIIMDIDCSRISSLPMEKVDSRIHPVSISRGQKIKTITSLFKLRIVLLLLIAAMSGAVVGAGGWPGGVNVFPSGFHDFPPIFKTCTNAPARSKWENCA